MMSDLLWPHREFDCGRLLEVISQAADLLTCSQAPHRDADQTVPVAGTVDCLQRSLEGRRRQVSGSSKSGRRQGFKVAI